VGAEREMARARGVAAVDRDRIISSLTAILDRQPAAINRAVAELEELRDRAADELSYEFAALIQQEIAALDWITSPQRASTMADTDCTASGWSDGMLVQFKIRGGRVCAWSQRACGQPVAAAALAATPDEWSGFMKRNADLAASLTELRTRPV